MSSLVPLYSAVTQQFLVRERNFKPCLVRLTLSANVRQRAVIEVVMDRLNRTIRGVIHHSVL